MPSVAIFRVNINMFTVRLGVTTSLLLILSVLPRATTAVPYNIRPWDKNGDLLIEGVQCPHANQCSWYRGEHGVSTRVSNNTTLDLTAQDSEYAEYYLLDDQYQSVVEYALVVPNGNAGSPFESNFIILHPCQTGTSNIVEFRYTININERAIDTRQHCDLRWNGLPHCAFEDGSCFYNGTDLMAKFSVRCRLATEKDNYISSIPIMIDQVDDLPLCPSENTSSIMTTYESITISSTNTKSTSVVPMNDTQPAPTNAKIIITTSIISTLSTATIAYQTTTSGLTPTSVNHMPSSLATFNATHETSTSSTSTTTSDQGRNIIIAALCATTVIILLLLFLPLLIYKVYVSKKSCKERNNSNTEPNAPKVDMIILLLLVRTENNKFPPSENDGWLEDVSELLERIKHFIQLTNNEQNVIYDGRLEPEHRSLHLYKVIKERNKINEVSELLCGIYYANRCSQVAAHGSDNETTSLCAQPGNACTQEIHHHHHHHHHYNLHVDVTTGPALYRLEEYTDNFANPLSQHAPDFMHLVDASTLSPVLHKYGLLSLYDMEFLQLQTITNSEKVKFIHVKLLRLGKEGYEKFMMCLKDPDAMENDGHKHLHNKLSS